MAKRGTIHTGHTTIGFSIICIVLAASFAYGQTTYYVSSSTGSDSNNGTTTGTPWKTVSKVSHHAKFLAGDSILFKRGDVFDGELSQQGLNGNESGSIVFGAYGNGPRPIFYGDMSSAVWTKSTAFGLDSIYKAWSGFITAIAHGYENKSGTWTEMQQKNQRDLQFYLSNPDSLRKFLGGLTPSSFGWAGGGDTAWVRTWDGNPPKVKLFHDANYVYGNHVIVRDLEFRNFSNGVSGIGTYHNFIVRNVRTLNILNVAIFIAGHSTNAIVDSCRADSSGQTCIYDQQSYGTQFNYDTVVTVRTNILGMPITYPELLGIGFERDTAGVADHCYVRDCPNGGFDTWLGVNDTIRYSTVADGQSGIYLNGKGWVAHNNTVTTTQSGGIGIQVDHSMGPGLTTAYANTITSVGAGQRYNTTDSSGGTVSFHDNIITLTGAATNRFADYQIYGGLTSTNNSFRGAGRFSWGLWPNEHVYNTLASFQAQGYESGSVWYSGTGAPTGTFTATPDSLPEGGGDVTLQWTSTNVTSAAISYKINGVDTVMIVDTVGTRTVHITSTTAFLLTLMGPFGTTTLNATVIVNATPMGYFLRQNFPNPFSLSTSIEFGLPADNSVSLKVYDILGREIATLVEGIQSAGTHQIQWNPKGIASGVYRYRLTSGSFSKTYRLVIVR